MLVDQPFIPVSHLQALVSQATRAPHEAVGTGAGGRCMAPAYLPRRLWPQVFQLERVIEVPVGFSTRLVRDL